MIHYELNYGVNADKSTHCSGIKKGEKNAASRKFVGNPLGGVSRLSPVRLEQLILGGQLSHACS